MLQDKNKSLSQKRYEEMCPISNLSRSCLCLSFLVLFKSSGANHSETGCRVKQANSMIQPVSFCKAKSQTEVALSYR